MRPCRRALAGASSSSISAMRALTGVSAPASRRTLVRPRQDAPLGASRGTQHGDACRPEPAAPQLRARGAAFRCRSRRAPDLVRLGDPASRSRTSASTMRRAPGMAHEDLDARPVDGGGHAIEDDAAHRAWQSASSSQTADAALLDIAQRSGIAGAEGIEPVRVDLLHVERAVDRAGAHDDARRCAPGVAATATASRTFCGPSGASAVAGRIAHVSTTGFEGAKHRCRKNAVSSSVSVPCVMTMPATSGSASQCAHRCASAARWRSPCPCCRPARPARPRRATPRARRCRPAVPRRRPAPAV